MALGKLRKEKIESIKRTFERTKSLKETAEIEGVVERTVSKHVTPEETVPISVGPNSSKISVDDSEQVKRDLDIRFKVFKAFESGSTNVSVCLKFKLSPELVIKYREEYDMMKKSDFDVELEKRNILKKEVEAAIQRRNEELSEVKSRIEKENARWNELQDRLSRSSEVYLKDFLQKMAAMPENHLYEYAYPVITSDFYAKAMAELNVIMVLGAITRDPNFDRILHQLENRRSQNFSPVNDIWAAAGVDLQSLVNDVKKNTARSALEWKEGWQAKNYYAQRAKNSSPAE